MKKIILLLVLLLMPLSVDALNKIHSIDIDIYLNKDGSANITETWNVDGDGGTEWYKVMNGLGNSELSNFTVLMDGKKLQYKEWNINESLDEKKGYYGINYTSYGLELCFGKYDYDQHIFVLKYNLSNFVFNTNDSQVLYFKLIDRLSEVDFDNFSVTVSSYYEFPNSLDVWGYGYKGFTYVSNGKIEMSNDIDMDDLYVVLLVKFPIDTFNTFNNYSYFNSFSDVYNKAEENTYDYNYGKQSVSSDIPFELIIMIILIPVLLLIVIPIIIVYSEKKNKYGYVGNKTINKKNVPMFRDIPCNKDIYYASSLIKLNRFGYRASNILGAILLKWVKNKKIVFKNDNNVSIVDMTMNPTFDNKLEERLFKMMYDASKDGFLEVNELKKWCNKNYDKFLNLFDKIENDTIRKMKENGLINKRKNKIECKCLNVMCDKIYNDSVELYGLKKYLEEFSNIDTKEVMDVHLWDEYLMFAYLFGIADKVLEQLEKLYPNVPEQDEDFVLNDLDYQTIVLINRISFRSVSSATSARAKAYDAASNYSSGGGGFSSGGGGGGSFGGGGGGSR